MERTEFVKALNADLETEFSSIIQYVQHVAVIKGAEHLSTIDELRRHLSQELNHAQILAEQIDFLGGVPTTTIAPVSGATEASEALKADLALERDQFESLPRAIRSGSGTRIGRRRRSAASPSRADPGTRSRP